MGKSIADRANVSASIVLNRKGEHVATVRTFYGSGGGVTVEVFNHGDRPQQRCLDTALKIGRITEKQLAARIANAVPDYYVTDEAKRSYVAYELFQSQTGRAGGYGYDKKTAALSGCIIDGHSIANHCGGVPEDEGKRAALMRAYIADAKAGWPKGGSDNYAYWRQRAAKIGCSFANWSPSRADAEAEARVRHPEMGEDELREYVNNRGNYSPDASRMQSLHFASGLDRLHAFGYRVISAI